MSTATEQVAPSAVDNERTLEAHIANANETRAHAQRDVRRWIAELAAAERAKIKAIQDQIQGREGADAAISAAAKAMQVAVRHHADAAQRRDVALSLAKELEGRLTQVRTFCLPELAAAMDPLVADYHEQQRELETGLRKLAASHDAITRRCKLLEVGCRAKVEEIDSQRGQHRSDAKVEAEARPPENPLPPAAIAAIVNDSPLPLVLRDDYQPDKTASAYIAAPAEDGALDIIWPGDPRHQVNAGPTQGEITEGNVASVARRAVR